MHCDVHDFAAKTYIAIVVMVIAILLTITTPYCNKRLFDIGYILLYGYIIHAIFTQPKMIRLVSEIRSTASRVLRSIKSHRRRLTKKYDII